MEKCSFAPTVALTIPPVRLASGTRERMKMKRFTGVSRKERIFPRRIAISGKMPGEVWERTNGRVLKGYRSNAILSTQVPQETPGQLRTVYTRTTLAVLVEARYSPRRPRLVLSSYTRLNLNPDGQRISPTSTFKQYPVRTIQISQNFLSATLDFVLNDIQKREI